MGVQLHNIDMLHLLWVIPALIALYVFAAQRRRRALELFVGAGLLGKVTISVSSARRRWKALLLMASVALTVFSLTRPSWNPKPETVRRQGRDVIFILDVSKSMLAEDLAPNRLERAKIAILDCIEKLQGDRVAIIAFAGTAAVKCPLTLDYGFFRMMVNDISVDSIARGGTMIGDAIRKAMTEVFDSQEKKYRDIVLITDGGDHDSFPLKAAEDAGNKGARLIVIGLGSENEGQRIPVTDEQGRKTFLKYKGQEVWSKLDADTLQKMANATPGGVYLNVATGTIELDKVYEKLIAASEKKDLESKTIKRYEEKFQVFLALALALVIAETLVGDRARMRRA